MNSVIELQQVIELLTQSPLPTGRGLLQRTLDCHQPLRFCMTVSRLPQMRMESVQLEVHMEIDRQQPIRRSVSQCSVLCTARIGGSYPIHWVHQLDCDYQSNNRVCCNCILVFCNSQGAESQCNPQINSLSSGDACSLRSRANAT